MNLCYPAGVEQDTLGQGGLPGVDVCRDPDVADPLIGKDTRGACPTTINEYLCGLTKLTSSSQFSAGKIGSVYFTMQCFGLLTEHLG